MALWNEEQIQDPSFYTSLVFVFLSYWAPGMGLTDAAVFAPGVIQHMDPSQSSFNLQKNMIRNVSCLTEEQAGPYVSKSWVNIGLEQAL